ADLEKRLHSRAQDSHEVILGRMNRASHEMSHWAEYDYIVVNHDIEAAFAEVQSILKAERLKRERRTGLTAFVRDLQRQLEKERAASLRARVFQLARAGRLQFVLQLLRQSREEILDLLEAVVVLAEGDPC